MPSIKAFFWGTDQLGYHYTGSTLAQQTILWHRIHDRKFPGNLSLHGKVCAQGQLSFCSHTNENTQIIVVADLCLQVDHTASNLLNIFLNFSPSQIANII